MGSVGNGWNAEEGTWHQCESHMLDTEIERTGVRGEWGFRAATAVFLPYLLHMYNFGQVI